MSHDQFDVSLEDSDLLSEVEVTTNLIVAATEYERHLTDHEIDQILDVVPESRQEAWGSVVQNPARCLASVRRAGSEQTTPVL